MTDLESFSAAYRDAVDEIISLVPNDLSAIAKHNLGWMDFDHKQYLLNSEVRYLKVAQILISSNTNSILDVGGFMAAFPLALKRLGFKVSIAEKFGYYGHALDGIAAHLMANGVEVIDMDFTESGNNMSELSSEYDAVTCMAVAEHLAHTPRYLLENIMQCLKPGGTFIFEVPNLAFCPRRYSFFFKGNSVLSPISDVYHSAIPFTGHHREYTLDDARYVVNEAGFRIVSEQTFNYSINSGSLLEKIKYAPAFLFKEWAELILLHCQKAK